jgi:hypothetical protein
MRMVVSGNISSGPTPARGPKMTGVRGRQNPGRPHALVSTRGQSEQARSTRTDDPSITSPTEPTASGFNSNRVSWSGGEVAAQRAHAGTLPCRQSRQARLVLMAKRYALTGWYPGLHALCSLVGRPYMPCPILGAGWERQTVHGGGQVRAAPRLRCLNWSNTRDQVHRLVCVLFV